MQSRVNIFQLFRFSKAGLPTTMMVVYRIKSNLFYGDARGSGKMHITAPIFSLIASVKEINPPLFLWT